MHIGTSSIQVQKEEEKLQAARASLWATMFPSRRVWQKTKDLKWGARTLISAIKCPKGAAMYSSEFMAQLKHNKVLKKITTLTLRDINFDLYWKYNFVTLTIKYNCMWFVFFKILLYIIVYYFTLLEYEAQRWIKKNLCRYWS